MTQAQAQLIKEIKTRKLEEARKLIEKTREVRRKITAVSGTWNAVEILRHIRYGK